MTVLEKITAWLKTFPQWEENAGLDGMELTPGSIGLFPQGIEEIARREDVLGNVQVTSRFTMMVYRVAAGDGPAWMLALQQWVNQQSAAGLAPRLGDIPEKEQIRAEQGRLSAPNQTGTKRYAVKLTAEYDVRIDN